MSVSSQSPATWRSAVTDARSESIVRSSRLFRILDRMLAIAIAAWTHSIVGAISRQTIERAKEGTFADRVLLAGAVTTVASATALAIQQLASRPSPLIWIVPAMFLVAGVGLIAVARVRPAR